ncbi:DUF6262 family protein [Neobacillus sp. NPDC093127]|uniref:DUF6262 family protein n=1 Tax=Neobacillus sp. NPDC093127 TaxID=3364296 RepID=UPI0038093FC7
MSNHQRNVEGIRNFAKQKTGIARDKVDKAIKTLIKKKEPINFNSVSEFANVSKTFLYQQEDIKERIQKLRKQQYEVVSPRAIKRNMRDESKDRIIEVQRETIKGLKEEIKALKVKLQLNYSHEYENL